MTVGKPDKDGRRRAVAGAAVLLAVGMLGALAAVLWLSEGLNAAALEAFMRDLGPWGPAVIVVLMVAH